MHIYGQARFYKRPPEAPAPAPSPGAAPTAEPAKAADKKIIPTKKDVINAAKGTVVTPGAVVTPAGVLIKK